MGQACNVCGSRRGRKTNDEFTSHIEGRTVYNEQRKLQSFEEFYDISEHPTFFDLACRNRFGFYELKLIERV